MLCCLHNTPYLILCLISNVQPVPFAVMLMANAALFLAVTGDAFYL